MRCQDDGSLGADTAIPMTPPLEAFPPAYVPRDPSQTLLYQVVADHLETFLASLDAALDARGLPAYVERAFYDYLTDGVSLRKTINVSLNLSEFVGGWVVSLQSAGKSQRPAWRPEQGQKGLEERALRAAQWPSDP